MRKLVFFLLLFMGTGGFAWQLDLQSSQKLDQNLGVLYQFKAYQYKHFPVWVNMVALNSNYHATLYIQHKDDIKNLSDIAKQMQAVVASNGGFYREGFVVNGLLINHQRKYARFVKNSLLSGIVTINEAGKVTLLPRSGAYQHAYSAFQTGPVLIQNGDIKPVDDKAMARRIVYAQDKNGRLFILFFDNVTLMQAAKITQLLARYLKLDFKIAVNFDGGKAAALYANGTKSPLILDEVVPVKSIILFTAER
ncbi:phosphodiester glycosidase family protein [Facilibium subflavum]|uniref:phosphodiester glycosidase family protein n=1 Tax=Facilibium subflavum TaxID=2219058 RepID=UPI000E656928|nr:phosphodiester glycosidase family protein [Facilibium subflavum]